MTGRYSFTLTQDGMVAASGDAPDFATAYREGMHYAMMYAHGTGAFTSAPTAVVASV